MKCGVINYKNGRRIVCPSGGAWRHPRWPAAFYCPLHQARLADIFPDGWKPVTRNQVAVSDN